MKIYAVGIGPGDRCYLAPKAREIIQDCDVVVGYTSYIELIAPLLEGKRIISTGMAGEVARCEMAFEEALKGGEVAVISSGDAGIYGMAPLLYEMSEKYPNVDIEVIPGITAAVSAASVLGSPLSNDFAVVSLSDLTTPWDVIERRLSAASMGDFVICLYNPASTKRTRHLESACNIALKYKPSQTLCGYVRNALRGSAESFGICRLDELPGIGADMLTTVIIGNSDTRIVNGKLVTVRGYDL